MIGKVQRGKRINGLICYLFGPGECNEHVNPHVVAGFRPPAALEPPLRPDGSRDVRTLNMLLNQPLALIPEEQRHERPVRHIVLRAAPEDPVLSDDDWAAIAHEVMDATGRAPRGDDFAVRWVAVRHAPDHIHIAFNLARQDGGRPPAWDDYRALRQACQRIEARYGLRSTAPADGTAAKRPTRAETEHAQRSGRPEPARSTLRRTVQQAAAGADSEAEFFARLAADGLLVRQRHSAQQPDQVTGYAVALPGHSNKAGEPVWFGGGKLAADLTLPNLRHRWTSTRPATEADPRAVLRDAVVGAAAASSGERQFFTALAERGLRVRYRFSHLDPEEITGYAVTTPTLHGRTGGPIWVAGARLGPDLTLPRLRHRWAAGARGAPLRDDAWQWAADAVGRAADDVGHLTGQGPHCAADAAWAAADVLQTTARRLESNGLLRQAADTYDRAARDPHGRTPPASRIGADLRAAARMLAGQAGEERERTQAILTMLDQLSALADAVAQLRATQARSAQSAAAARAAALLHTARIHVDFQSEHPRLNQAAPARSPAVRAALADFPSGPAARLHVAPAGSEQAAPRRAPQPPSRGAHR